MAKFRILSLDGGGIRGIVTAIILDRLQQSFPNLLNNVHLMSGTSTGGLLALGLRAGKTPAELRDLYIHRSRKIFEYDLLEQIVDVGGLIAAKYETKNRAKVFKQTLGANTLMKDLNGRVLIPAFDLKDTEGQNPSKVWAAALFHNFPPSNTEQNDLPAWKVAMYTTAAPTFFPSYNGYIDGGVFANNPCMCALAQTQDGSITPKPQLTSIRLLSLGTGINRHAINGKNLDWGLKQWAPYLMDMLTESSMDVARYHCEQLLGNRFHRYAPYLPNNKEIGLDDVDSLGWLQNWAENILQISELEQWVQTQWL